MANISLDDSADELYAEIRDNYDVEGIRALINFAFRLAYADADNGLNVDGFLRRALTGRS